MGDGDGCCRIGFLPLHDSRQLVKMVMIMVTQTHDAIKLSASWYGRACPLIHGPSAGDSLYTLLDSRCHMSLLEHARNIVVPCTDASRTRKKLASSRKAVWFLFTIAPSSACKPVIMQAALSSPEEYSVNHQPPG